ncbi:MAG: DUF6057 family protein [Odoribacteraceae bacterium]|jgi:hypothetical protein|nr:DUF6057 family protein [Odoribacteraceae bacterium]
MKEPNPTIARAKALVEPIAFALFIICYAGIYRRDFFARVQELSPLLPDALSPRELLEWPGMATRLAGSFLTRLFYYPLAGAVLLAALLSGARWLTASLCRLPAAARFLSYLPALLLFLSITRLDHVLFVPAGENFLLGPSLGVFLALLIAAGARWTRWRRPFVACAVIVGYPLLGFYALFAVLLVGGRRRDVAWAVAWVIAYPLLYFASCYNLSLFNAYTAGLLLPENHGAAWWNWLPLAGALVTIAALAASKARDKDGKRYRCANAAGLLLSCAGVFFLSNRDASFQALLSMQYHAARDRWDVVLERASAVKAPDRLVILYRNTALLKLQRLCDEMFTFPREGAAMPPYPRMVYIAGCDLFFYHGHLNHAYRWATEHFVQHGISVDALRVMTRVALLNGESSLALKHARALERIPFHAREAREYRRHAERPATLLDASFLPRGLSSRDNKLGEKTALVEPFLLEYYRDTPPDTRETLELSIAATLTLKAIDRFQALFPLYEQNGIAAPLHAREAALLFARLEQGDEDAIPGVDPATRRRFERFLVALVDARARPPVELSLKALEKPFGNTYWYYYFVVKNLKTN